MILPIHLTEVNLEELNCIPLYLCWAVPGNIRKDGSSLLQCMLRPQPQEKNSENSSPKKRFERGKLKIRNSRHPGGERGWAVTINRCRIVGWLYERLSGYCIFSFNFQCFATLDLWRLSKKQIQSRLIGWLWRWHYWLLVMWDQSCWVQDHVGVEGSELHVVNTSA